MSTRQISVPAVSLETIQVKVALRNNGASVDPTAYTVKFAATTVGVDPVTGDFVTGSWDTDGGIFHAQVSVSGTGNGGTLALDAGVYDLWVKIQESTTTPVRNVGRLVIT